MLLKKTKDAGEIYKSVFIAHFILILHVLLITCLGFLVLFFRGIVIYMPWIFLGGTAVIATSGYYFYRRIKKEGKTLQELLALPVFSNRSVEVTLFGGMASLKVGKPNHVVEIGNTPPNQLKQLENSDSIDIDELTALARLLESDLITIDEYKKAKQKIFKTY